MARRRGARISQGLERGDPHRLCLRRAATHRVGQVKGNGINEIVAIPPLLNKMSIEGAVVTIDRWAASVTSPRKLSRNSPITLSP